SFWMMLGIIIMPTVTSCFSTHPLLMTEVFKRIFIRKRYENLVRALHFVDADTENSDRLNRLRPIISHLNDKFQSNYVLDKDICIDKSLTLWKGRLDIKQYIRSKASKFGIKTFELCESVTGYLWSFIVYTGKQSSAELVQEHGVLKSTAVVKKLMAPLLNHSTVRRLLEALNGQHSTVGRAQNILTWSLVWPLARTPARGRAIGL
ncbi:piggyBac transposable element-derived protein 4-like, partial [Colias croceus]|uniref:piggyBac transposable element-derived protein 4-like n=1 Tax=Colias crocea TaxID=72248 RepID=UPI001E27BA83